MTNDLIISWHPKAVLYDRDGNRATDIAHPSIKCDPTDPITALPAFIAAIATGTLPIMGHFDGKRPTCVGDFLTQTGGSTGTPKTILRSSESWLKSFRYMAQHYNIGPYAKVATLGHLNHSLALYAGLEALHLGADFHALGGIKPQEYTQELHKRSITHLYATPTQLQLMRQGAVHGVQTIFIGGGKLTPANQTHATALFPNAEIIEFYGAAETSFITLSDVHTLTGSVGRPFADVIIDIRKSDGTSCKPGEIGEVWVKTPLAFKGYLPKPENTQDYINVGEMGTVDENGYLYLSGRSDRAVTIADQTVFLDQVEATIMQFFPQHNIAVFAIPNDIRENTLHLVTQSSDLCLDDITVNLPRHIQPRTITHTVDWPLLPSGKTDYKSLERLIKGNTDG